MSVNSELVYLPRQKNKKKKTLQANEVDIDSTNISKQKKLQ